MCASAEQRKKANFLRRGRLQRVECQFMMIREIEK